MGMFDTVICHLPLPIAEPWATALRDAKFQTKDLDCTLTTYHLRADGSLWFQRRSDGDADPIEAGADTGFAWERRDHVGVLDFYGSPPVTSDESARRSIARERSPFITFRATFDIRGLRVLELVSAERLKS